MRKEYFMPDFNDFFKTLKSDLTNLAEDQFSEFKDRILEDGTRFAHDTKEDIERWGELLEAKKLKPDEFEFLLKAKKDNAEMEALKAAGLAQVKLDELKNKIFDTIFNSMLKVFT